MAAAGIDRRAAQVRLNQCLKAGLLVRPESSKRGWYALPGPAGDHQTQQPAPALPVVQSPTRPAVVIAAVGPAVEALPVDVAAQPTPDTTTATCTSTVQPAPAGSFDDLLALVEERAAILEVDAGHDRETADRLAREMVLGRDAQPAQADDIVAGIDTASLAARATPYVRQVLDRFTGTVRLIDDRDDPFAGRRRRDQPSRAGTCRCGHDDWVQVPIHGGRSTRVDCRHCDRFGWFAVWHGQPLAGPSAEAPAGPDPPNAASLVGLSFTPAAGVLVPTG